jgi:hypothetical protein
VRKYVAILIALTATFLSQVCVAKSVGPAPLWTLYVGASVVVEATIERQSAVSLGGTVCAIQYTAVVDKIFKGPTTLHRSARITIGRTRGLQRGTKYLLFLEWIADPRIVYQRLVERGDISAHDPKQRIFDLIRCRGTLPGLFFDDISAWPIKDRGIHIEGFLPRHLPKSIRVERRSVLDNVLREEDVSAYLLSLNGLSGFEIIGREALGQ